MSAAAILYENLSDDGTITASSSTINTPPATLQNHHVARKWRGSLGNTEHILLDLGALTSVDVVALFGMNLTSAGTTRVRIATADSSGQTGDAYDSTALVGEVSDDHHCLIDLLPAPVSGRYVRIDMTETGLDYVEAGRLVVGLTTQFEINFAPGWARAYVDRSRRTESRGGQMYIDRETSYRTLDLTFERLTEDERYGVIEQIDLLNGHSTDVLMITDPESDDLPRDSLWGLVEDMTPVVQPSIEAEPVFVKTFRLRERL